MEKRDIMASMPVKKLMLSMGIPIIFSMVLQAVYNIVDSVFVANMNKNGELAVTALTLAFPFQMFMVAIAIGTGVGVNALVSRTLGQGDKENASKATGNALFMGIIIYAVFLIFGLFGVKTYISSQTENELICSMASDYLRICCVLSFRIVFFAIYEKLLQASGNSLYSTIAQVSGAVINIVLDPIMIYGYFGCPEFGVKGAGYATVIGQIISCIVGFIFHIKVNKSISNGLKYMKPSLYTIKMIYAIGLPAIIAQALMSVMTYGLNIILGGVSEAMVTAYGLYYKIQQFILFAVFGLRDAITPIISYSHGMGNKERIRDGIKYGMLFALVIMFVGLAVIEIFAVPFSEGFKLSADTQAFFISAMRIVSVSFIFAGINIAFQGIFQALDGGIEALIGSLCRQLVFIFPLVYFFVNIANKNPEYMWVIWTAFLISEFLSAVIAVMLFKRLRKY